MRNSLLFLGDWYIRDTVKACAAVEQFPFIFNLEGPISRRGVPASGKILLRMERNQILDCFGRLPAAVCLANNHISDYGNDAFEDTLAELRSLGIPYFGAGKESDNYHNPAIVIVDDHRIALLGYVCPSTHPIFADQEHYGVCAIDLDRISRDIHDAREQGATRVVVCLHWGCEDILLPTPQDVRKAHEIINRGADVIIGHHAHSPHPIEVYRRKTIAYGLGNLAMSQDWVPIYENGSTTTPEAMFHLRLRYWNRASWGLIWNADDMSNRTKQLYFDDCVVLERPFKRNLERGNVASWFYPLRFRLHIPVHTLSSVAPEYFKTPTRLRPRHLSAALHILLRSKGG